MPGQHIRIYLDTLDTFHKVLHNLTSSLVVGFYIVSKFLLLQTMPQWTSLNICHFAQEWVFLRFRFLKVVLLGQEICSVCISNPDFSFKLETHISKQEPTDAWKRVACWFFPGECLQTLQMQKVQYQAPYPSSSIPPPASQPPCFGQHHPIHAVAQAPHLGSFFYFSLFIYLFIYLFRLHWVFVAAHGLSLVAASRSYSFCFVLFLFLVCFF